MFKQVLAFIGITIIAFIAFLEFMVVNNALPTIQEVFHESTLNLQWINNIYSITLATTMILFGKLGDLFGYRRIFYIGILLFILGSFGAGYSSHFEFLILSRGIQSLGIAMIIVLAPGIIQMLFKDKVHTPMSIYATVTGLGLIIGPYLGGIIVTYFGWSWIFYINIPLLLISWAICLPLLPEFKATKVSELKIDWTGNILLIISLVSLIYALIREQQIGLDSIAIICFIIFIICTPIFIYVELNQNHPILNFKFFKQPDFVLATLSNAMCGSLISCGMFFSPIFLQKVINLSPQTAGSVLLFFALGTVGFSPIIGRMVKKIQERKTILCGLYFGFAASISYILFFYTGIIPIALCAFFLTGTALAVNNVVSATSAIKGVGQENSGVAIGTIFAGFNIIAAIMLAITSVLFDVFTKFYQQKTFIENAKLSYASVFVLIGMYALILLVIGYRTQKAK